MLSLLDKTDHVATDSSPPDSFANLSGPHSLISHISTTKWIIDSGCTDHICNDLFLFTNMNNISDANHKITTPNGTQHKVTKKGNIEIFVGILLKDVLYVLDFKFNHLSVYKICFDMGVTISFSQQSCFLQDPLMKTSLHLGNIHQGLYYTLVQSTFSPSKTHACQPIASFVSSKTV